MKDVNKIPETADGALYQFGRPNYRIEVIDEETGEKIYSQAAPAGILCIVEQYEVLKESKEIDGNQQHFMWGPAAVVAHASMMHTKKMHHIVKQDSFFRQQVLAVFGDTIEFPDDDE